MSGTRPVYTIAKEMGLASKVLVEAINGGNLGFTVKSHSSRLSAAEEKLLSSQLGLQRRSQRQRRSSGSEEASGSEK